MQANLDIRQGAKEAGLCLWQVGAAIGLNDGNFSRLLRKELPADRKEEIFKVIRELSEKEVGA